MLRMRTVVTVLATTLAASALWAGGTLAAAWAGWTTSTNASVRAAGGRLPAVSAPHATLLTGGGVDVRWRAAHSSIPVDRYVVTRISEANRKVVCVVPATSCRDESVSADSIVRYIVHVMIGRRWSGPGSAPSDAVLTGPGEPAAQRAATGRAPTELPKPPPTAATDASTAVPTTASSTTSPTTAPPTTNPPPTPAEATSS